MLHNVTDFILKFLLAFLTGLNLHVPSTFLPETLYSLEGKPQKIELRPLLTNIHHTGLLLIECQSLKFNPLLEPGKLFFCERLLMNNYKIICIGYHPAGCLCVDQYAEIIQVNICKQRRYDSMNTKGNFEFDRVIKHYRKKND